MPAMIPRIRIQPPLFWAATIICCLIKSMRSGRLFHQNRTDLNGLRHESSRKKKLAGAYARVSTAIKNRIRDTNISSPKPSSMISLSRSGHSRSSRCISTPVRPKPLFSAAGFSRLSSMRSGKIARPRKLGRNCSSYFSWKSGHALTKCPPWRATDCGFRLMNISGNGPRTTWSGKPAPSRK